MKVVIPVAGLGKRLRPLTFTMPKALVKVAGKPVLFHILDGISGLKIDEIIIVSSPWGSEEIKRAVLSYSKNKVEFIIQKEPDGLGDAIFLTKEAIPPEEPLLILLGDTILEYDITPFLKKRVDFLGVYRVSDPHRFGIALLDKEGRIIELEEKPDEPKSDIALVGLYFIQRADNLFRSLDYVEDKGIRTKGEIQLTDALQNMVKNGWRPKALFVEGWHDCGKIETLLASNKELLQKSDSTLSDTISNSEIVGPVYIEQGVQIEDSRIGPYASIGAGSKIIGSKVENSIIHNFVGVYQSTLYDSVIGNQVIIKSFRGRVLLGDLTKIEGGLPTL